jgi:uncharacterized membrane-anchored protein
MKCVPKIDHKYWIAICIASVFGANSGDYLADALNLGHLNGLPVEAAILAAILLSEVFLKVSSALFYWAAIIVVRAAATNIGDVFHDWKIPFSTSVPAVFVVLLIAVAIWKMARKDAMSNGSIQVGAFYWVTMFIAGVLGTVVGDDMSFGLRFGPLHAAMIQYAVLAVVFLIGYQARLLPGSLFYFWLSIAVVRSAGTSAGDYFAHTLGLGTSTLSSGAVFVAAVLLFYGRLNKHVVLKTQTAGSAS